MFGIPKSPVNYVFANSSYQDAISYYGPDCPSTGIQLDTPDFTVGQNTIPVKINGSFRKLDEFSGYLEQIQLKLDFGSDHPYNGTFSTSEYAIFFDGAYYPPNTSLTKICNKYPHALNNLAIAPKNPTFTIARNKLEKLTGLRWQVIQIKEKGGWDDSHQEEKLSLSLRASFISPSLTQQLLQKGGGMIRTRKRS